VRERVTAKDGVDVVVLAVVEFSRDEPTVSVARHLDIPAVRAEHLRVELRGVLGGVVEEAGVSADGSNTRGSRP
jgi:hypothetical protein